MFNHQRISQRDVRKSLRLLLLLTQLKKKNLTFTLPVQSQGQWLIKSHLENAQVENGHNSDYLYNLDGTFSPSMYHEIDLQTFWVCLHEEQVIYQNAPLTQDKFLIEPSVHVSNKQDFSTKTLILEQQKGSTVSSLYENIMSEDEISSVPCCYYKKIT